MHMQQIDMLHLYVSSKKPVIAITISALQVYALALHEAAAWILLAVLNIQCTLRLAGLREDSLRTALGFWNISTYQSSSYNALEEFQNDPYGAGAFAYKVLAGRHGHAHHYLLQPNGILHHLIVVGPGLHKY